jgi:hypothetical protein
MVLSRCPYGPGGDLPPGTTLDGVAVGSEEIMKAKVGDRLIMLGTHVGDAHRVGIIIELRNPEGDPPYVVKWLDTGHEAFVYPGTDARVEPPTVPV